MSNETGEPEASEWIEDVDGECRIDLPMKAQVTEDLEIGVMK